METVEDWNGNELGVCHSRASAVPYVTSWRRNVIAPPGGQWPAWLEKQVTGYTARADWFDDADAQVLSAELGRISKFQSLNSEDAVTWSWFGTLALAEPKERAAALQWLLNKVGLAAEVTPEAMIDQWSRVHHPNVPESPRGPEIDARVSDTNLLMYVEAKWHAELGSGRGAQEGKRDDQVVLRRESITHDPALAEHPGQRLVLGVSNHRQDVSAYARGAEASAGRQIEVRWMTWQDLTQCGAHPHADEFKRYLDWKNALNVA